MELDKLSQSIDSLLRKLKESENQVDYLRQRESNLLATIKNLQVQNEQNKNSKHYFPLKTVEEQT